MPLLSWKDGIIVLEVVVVLIVHGWNQDRRATKASRGRSMRLAILCASLIAVVGAISIVTYGACATSRREKALRSLETHVLALVAFFVFFAVPASCRASLWPLFVVTLVPLLLNWLALLPLKDRVSVDDFSWRADMAVLADGIVLTCIRFLPAIMVGLLTVPIVLFVKSRCFDAVVLASFVVLAGSMSWCVRSFAQFSWERERW
ncbi:hypothetical protein EBZ80_19965 [bacterium]|nr:hypothetical protein [bacterium]